MKGCQFLQFIGHSQLSQYSTFIHFERIVAGRFSLYIFGFIKYDTAEKYCGALAKGEEEHAL